MFVLLVSFQMRLLHVQGVHRHAERVGALRAQSGNIQMPDRGYATIVPLESINLKRANQSA